MEGWVNDIRNKTLFLKSGSSIGESKNIHLFLLFTIPPQNKFMTWQHYSDRYNQPYSIQQSLSEKTNLEFVLI